MKIIVVMALLIAGISAAPNLALADIEDNQIVIENFGNTESVGYKKKKRFGPFSRTRDYRGSNAGGVIIECASGSSCKRNRISIRNTGNVYSGRGGTVAGVTMRE